MESQKYLANQTTENLIEATKLLATLLSHNHVNSIHRWVFLAVAPHPRMYVHLQGSKHSP